jgi:choline dehydrogenase
MSAVDVRDDTWADVIIVGAGSAGATLAARLAQAGHDRVLLLEAGRDEKSLWLKLPLGVGKVLIGHRAVRRYFTQPEPTLGGRRIFWPRGETVGGSGRINGTVWVHGDPREYDHWAALGNAGWGSETLLPIFRRMESYSAGNLDQRGRDGPIRITEYTPRDPLSLAFLAGAESLGIPLTSDYNDTEYLGAGMLQHNTHRGWRCDPAAAMLAAARKRPNLRVWTHCLVARIVFEGTRAIGVEVRHGGRVQVLRARSEVILCAGSVASPGILERSGVGATARLDEAGITPRLDLPGVGENLQDHFHVRLNLAARNVTTLNDIMHSPLARARAAWRFVLHRDGLFASATCTAHALAASDRNDARADVKLQLHHLTSVDSRDPDRYVLDQESGFSIGAYQLRPRSRGSVHVASDDPEAVPLIRAGYLDAPEDRSATLRVMRLARRLVATAPFARFVRAELRPGPQVSDDDALLAYARATGTTSYHPVGTCRMGTDAYAVVDPSLRVRGIAGLRVADASIMPTLPSSNTNAACIAIGWRAADLLLEAFRA